MALNSETKNVACVLNIPKKCDLNNFIDKLKIWLNANTIEYHFIVHDLDKKINDNGESVLKTLHIHLLFKTEKKHRLSYFINNLSSALNIDTLLISVDIWKHYEELIQYLIHKNDKDKWAYDRKDIISSLDSKELDLILDRECTQNIDFEYLSYIVKLCKGDIVKIYNNLGLEIVKKYRFVVLDLVTLYRKGDLK